MSSAREQASTLKKNASHMILWWQIKEFVLSFISKKNYNEGLKFYKGKRSSFSLNQNFALLNDQFSNK